MVLDGPHLGEAERELPVPAQLEQAASSTSPDRHLDPPEVVGLSLAEPIERQGADDGLLDGVVGEDAARSGAAVPRRALDPIGPDRPDVRDG